MAIFRQLLGAIDWPMTRHPDLVLFYDVVVKDPDGVERTFIGVPVEVDDTNHKLILSVGPPLP